MDIHHFEPIAVAADGERVLGLVRIDATIHPTGKRLTTTEVHSFRVVDGRIAEYSPIVDGLAFSNAFTPA
jgi:ketosteroid isomerase-like protein